MEEKPKQYSDNPDSFYVGQIVCLKSARGVIGRIIEKRGVEGEFYYLIDFKGTRIKLTASRIMLLERNNKTEEIKDQKDESLNNNVEDNTNTNNDSVQTATSEGCEIQENPPEAEVYGTCSNIEILQDNIHSSEMHNEEEVQREDGNNFNRSNNLSNSRIFWSFVIFIGVCLALYFFYDLYHSYERDKAFQEMLLAKPSYPEIIRVDVDDYVGSYYIDPKMGFRVMIPRSYIKEKEYSFENVNMKVHEFIHETNENQIQIRTTDLYSLMKSTNAQLLGDTAREALSFNNFSRTNMNIWLEGYVDNFFSDLEENGFIITNKDVEVRQLGNNVLVYMDYRSTSPDGAILNRISYLFLNNGYQIELIGYLDENVIIDEVMGFLSSFEYVETK